LPAVCGATVITISLAAWTEIAAPRLLGGHVEPPAALIYGNTWMTYEPSTYNPHAAIEISRNSIEQELAWIRDAGFTGIITFSSRGALADVPELAKQQDLAVIMGVWDPTDQAEVELAISKNHYVDAYSVGHDHLGSLYSGDQVCATMREIRARAHRPVSTTQLPRDYSSAEACFVEEGDWLFPDFHITMRSGEDDLPANAPRDAMETLKRVRDIAELSQHGKPLLLKLVTYPVAGSPNASRDEQARFFEIIFESRRQPDTPLFAIAVHGSFDAPWKRGWPF
jgi:hypothetical protein